MKNKPFRILFMGTDHLSLQCLNQLINNVEFEITGVVTPPPRLKGRGLNYIPSLVAKRAKELSYPVLTPHNLNSPEFLSEVKNLNAHWVIVLSYGKLLPQSFLSLFPQKALNFHASLLPSWRGAAPIQRAIMAGDQKLGMCLQIMEKHLDTGPLIGSHLFKMNTAWDATNVYSKMESLIAALLMDLLKYMKGQIIPTPQDHSKATYAHKINKKECLIIWNQPASQICNNIRALVKGPQAYTIYNKKRLKIYKATLCLQDEYISLQNEPISFLNNKFSAGQIIHINSDYFIVACKNSLLKITQVQPESKKIISVKEFIKGYNLKLNTIL